jgi:hypothetical protein
MAASPEVIEILRESVLQYLSCCQLVTSYTRSAEPTSLLMKHLMNKGDGYRTFADG